MPRLKSRVVPRKVYPPPMNQKSIGGDRGGIGVGKLGRVLGGWCYKSIGGGRHR